MKIRPVMGQFDEAGNLVALLSADWHQRDTEELQSGSDIAGDYTLVLADAGREVSMANAATAAVTVPPYSSVAYPVGTLIPIYAGGAGLVNIVAGVGVTIVKPASRAAQVAERYETVFLRNRSLNVWSLAGALAEA